MNLESTNLSADFDLDILPSNMFLHATHHLVVMIISVKKILNPTMYDEVMGRHDS